MEIRDMVTIFNKCQDKYISNYSRLGVSISRKIGDMKITESLLSWPIDPIELGDLMESYIGDINPMAHPDNFNYLESE